MTIHKSRTKIDSEILLEIIYSTGKYHVLSEYIGAAALLFTNTHEPNVAYVWKGASKMYNYASSKVEEERPLFYYKENKNSLYISSIKDSLLTIGGVDDKNVFTFEENTLYRITDGDIDNVEKLVISRANATQRESTFHTSNSKTNAYDYLNNSAYSNYLDEEEWWNKPQHNRDLEKDKKYNNPKLQEIMDRRKSEKINSNVVVDNIYNEACGVS